MRHVEGRAPAWALGIALGLAASTKYTAAALGVPVLAAVWLRRRDPATARDRRAWLAAGLALIALRPSPSAGPPGTSLAASLHLPDLRLLHPESARAFVSGLARAALATGVGARRARGPRRLERARPPGRRLSSARADRRDRLRDRAFLVGTPGALAEPRAFLSDLAFNAQTRHEYKGLVGEGTSFLPYLAPRRPTRSRCRCWRPRPSAWSWPPPGSRGAGAWPPSLALAALAPYLLVASSGHRAMRFLAPALPAAA